MELNPNLIAIFVSILGISLWLNILLCHEIMNKNIDIRLLKKIHAIDNLTKSLTRRELNTENYKRFWQGYDLAKIMILKAFWDGKFWEEIKLKKD